MIGTIIASIIIPRKHPGVKENSPEKIKEVLNVKKNERFYFN